MKKTHLRLHALVLALSAIGTGAHAAASLQGAADLIGAARTESIGFSGTGRWFQFGQAPAPTLPWPAFELSSYSADINYAQPAARVQIVRKQLTEAGRARPLALEQRVDQYVGAGRAWNLAAPANAAAGAAPVASAQPGALAERNAEIWSTPQGFLRAALANSARTTTLKDGAAVSFTIDGKYRYVGQINAHNQLERVRTWIDNPVLGDTLVETRFSGYKDFNGVQFPTHIVRLQGGHPVLDLTVDAVRANPALALSTPAEVEKDAPPVKVTSTKLADGVYYFTGGTHHSVVIEQHDHIVVVEAPLNEERSLAVIAKIHETIPNKPIKYLINTHAHFDHSGGLRTYVDAGATVLTHAANRAYYQGVWAAPHTLNPDLLAGSKKAARFDTFTQKRVLTDGNRAIEIYPIDGNSHNDAFALVYLPAEKILIEADAYNPVASTQAPTAAPNPYSVNLYENIEKLKLDVDQIAGLHGPRVVKLDDLRVTIGRAAGVN